MSHGKNHICLVDIYGAITCSGDNEFQQIEFPANMNNIKILVSGKLHNCAYMSSPRNLRQLKCWGDDKYNQLNIPDAVLEKIKKYEVYSMTAGPYITCVSFNIENEYSYCWGLQIYDNFNEDNVVYKLGIASEVEIAIGFDSTQCATYQILSTRTIRCYGKCNSDMCKIPQRLTKNILTAGVGSNHVCIQMDHSYVKELACWGNDSYGQSSVPKDYALHSTAYAVGINLTCAVKGNTKVTCWGKHVSLTDLTSQLSRQVSTGGRHTCANVGGYLHCWGNDEFNQLDPPADQVDSSVQVAAGWDYNCSVNLEYKLECWGFNWLAQTDTPPMLQYHDVKVKEVAVGLHHSCARFKDPNNENNIMCWGGHDEYGQNSIPSKYTIGVLKLTVGDYHTCLYYREAEYFNGKPGMYGIHCSGGNEFGQIDQPLAKVQGNISALDAGEDHTCLAIFSLYRVYCWGSDSHGQSTVPHEFRGNMRVEYTDLFEIIAISAGSVHTCAIWLITEGISNLVCWGLEYYRTPESNWEHYIWQISTGWMHNCLIDNFYDIKCYGENDYGQCSIPEEVSFISVD